MAKRRESTVEREVKSTEAEAAWLNILSRLPPVSVAAVACTSSFHHKLCRTLTTLRSSDIARGLENYQVPAYNSVDSTSPYPYFLYTPSLISSQSRHIYYHSWPLSSSSLPPFNPIEKDIPFIQSNGCPCLNCKGDDCPCFQGGSKVYDKHGKLMSVVTELSCPVTECGPACSCDLGCPGRVSQRGLGVRLCIIKSIEKGWGLHCAESVQSGSFICEFAGEVLTIAEARARQSRYDEMKLQRNDFFSSLIVIREHLPSGQACLRLNIDATVIGNVACFINHSCDGGNLISVVIRSSGSILPRLCFFAKTNLSMGEELTFSYGSVTESTKTTPCFCKSPLCLGVLPSETT